MDESQPVKIMPLNEDELNMLRYRLASLFQLLEDTQIEIGDDEDTAQVCDHVVRWWHTQPETDRPDANDMVWMLGVALGEFLRALLMVDWRVVEDEYGTSVVLMSEGPEPVTLAPVDSIAKRFGEAPQGFVEDFMEGLAEAELIEPLFRADDDPGPEPLFPDDEDHDCEDCDDPGHSHG